MNPQVRTVALHGGTFISGVFAAVTLMASQNVDLYAAYNHAIAGVRELMAAWAIIGPVLFIGFGAYKATTRNKIKDVLADPEAPQIAREMPVTPAAVAVAVELAAKP